MQGIEVAKELINTNDATTIGVLLAFIVILLFFNGMQWKKAQKDEAYIRSQDKANLQMLSELAKSSESLGENVVHIKNNSDDFKPKINQVLNIIENRLNK